MRTRQTTVGVGTVWTTQGEQGAEVYALHGRTLFQTELRPVSTTWFPLDLACQWAEAQGYRIVTDD